MVLQVVVFLVAKFNFLKVDFDADFRYEHVLHSDFLSQFESTLVSHISKSIEKLFSPELK